MKEIANGFAKLSIDKQLCAKLSARNIVSPTDIQKAAIPAILAGNDVVGQSQTGTGKTLAYLLPILQKIDTALKHPQAVIVAPTQELAMQIASECKVYGEALQIESVPLIGGAALKRQVEQLKTKKPALVVGTPGRLLELIKLRRLRMHDVKMLVLDEADQLLTKGEEQSVEAILKSMLKERQVLLFSATIPAEMKGQLSKWVKDPVYIGITGHSPIADQVEHHYVVWEERDKIDLMRRLFHAYKPQSGLIFVNDSEQITELESKLIHVGLPVRAIYGQAGNEERTAVMREFRTGKIPLLLATDMAARGLDIDNVSHVFHFHVPVEATSYIHRVGRTGRMGKTGISVSLVSQREKYLLNRLERELGIVWHEKTVYQGKIINPQKKSTAKHRTHVKSGKRERSKK